MPRYAANLSMLFEEHDFIDRFAAAAQAGFKGVECLFPYTHPAEAIRSQLSAFGLELVLFNLPPGDWANGERGLSIYADRQGEFEASLGLALQYAEALGTQRLHVMAGIPREGEDPRALKDTYVRNLRYATRVARDANITLLIEPLNQRDVPGYFLRTTRQAISLIHEVQADNLKLQFDAYHVQISEGDVTMRLREALPYIGHVQMAGVPGRHEPTEGELSNAYLMHELDRLHYKGWVGAEYRPQGPTASGLGWLKDPRFSALL